MPHTATNQIDSDIVAFSNSVPPPPYPGADAPANLDSRHYDLTPTPQILNRPRLPEDKRNPHLRTRTSQVCHLNLRVLPDRCQSPKTLPSSSSRLLFVRIGRSLWGESRSRRYVTYVDLPQAESRLMWSARAHRPCVYPSAIRHGRGLLNYHVQSGIPQCYRGRREAGNGLGKRSNSSLSSEADHVKGQVFL